MARNSALRSYLPSSQQAKRDRAVYQMERSEANPLTLTAWASLLAAECPGWC